MSRPTKDIDKKALARLDPGKSNQHPLPGDILADLQDAFKFYDKENNDCITNVHFRNILHNFGFHRSSKKEIDEELKRTDAEILKRTHVDFDFIKYVVGYRWNKTGKEDEARECFKLFDKRDRSYINAGDLKAVLSNYLEFPVSENDIQDFINECGGNADGSGNIQFREFAKLYLS